LLRVKRFFRDALGHQRGRFRHPRPCANSVPVCSSRNREEAVAKSACRHLPSAVQQPILLSELGTIGLPQWVAFESAGSCPIYERATFLAQGWVELAPAGTGLCPLPSHRLGFTPHSSSHD